MWDSPLRLGRTVGGLLLVQMLLAALVNMVLFEPLIAPPGWIVNAAEQPLAIGLSVVLGVAAEAIWLAIAIALYPTVRSFSERHALTFVALAAVALALCVVENGRLLSMLSLSQAYTAAAGQERESFQAMRGVVGAARNWAHFTHLAVTGLAMTTFMAALWRFGLVPRALAAIGMAAAALQVVTVSLPIFGQRVIFGLLAPIGLALLATAAWLLAKGFELGRSTGADS
jgi:Domain of unknown function (DUF4386)